MPEETLPTSHGETPEAPAPSTTEEPAAEAAAPSPEPAAPERKPEDTVEYWRNRHAESSRENQVILGREREKDARIEQLTKKASPTEQELRESFPEWDQMLPHERRMAAGQLAADRKATAAEETVARLQAERAWEKDLKKAARTFPALSGREDEFEAFVMRPSHRTAPIDVLAKAFLSDSPAPQPAPAARPGVERGSGGPKELPARKKLSADDAKRLRETNSDEYKRQVAADNIDFDV